MAKTKHEASMLPQDSNVNTFGQWQFKLYDGNEGIPPVVVGRLCIDNQRYLVVDEDNNLLLTVPSGNVAFVQNLREPINSLLED